MLFKLKTLLQLIVFEYSITFFTFLAIFFTLSTNLENINLLIFPFLIYIFSIFGFNSLNQVFDIEIDRISKPFKPLSKNIFNKKRVIYFSIILYFISFLLSSFFGLLIQWFSLFIITMIYSNHFFKLRRFLITVPLIGLLVYVIIPFWLVASFFDFEINYLVVLFFSLIIISISFLKDIENIKGDKKVGFKSIPMLFGVEKSIKTSFNLLLLIILFFGLFFSFKYNFYFMIPTIFSIILVVLLLFLIKIRKNKIINSKILILFMVCTILIQLVFSLFFNKLLFDFIFSNINLKFIFLLFAYFLMPFGVKYIDEAFDSKTFNKKIATFVALILVIIGIFSLIIDPITAVFISGYIIGVLLTKKVDIKEYILFSICWLVAVVFLGVHIYLINNLLLLIIFILLTIFDEKGNNYADNYFKKFKNKNYFVLLLRFRIIVLIGAIILSVLGLLPLEYVLLIFIWLLGYNLPIFISEQLKH